MSHTYETGIWSPCAKTRNGVREVIDVYHSVTHFTCGCVVHTNYYGGRADRCDGKSTLEPWEKPDECQGPSEKTG